MAKSLFYRLFGAGKLPAAVRDELSGEAIVFQTEGVPVVLHMRGRVPGAYEGRGYRRGLGAFAVSDRRVLGTWGRGRVVDVPFGLHQPDGPAKLTLDETGLQVHWDLDRVHPSCHGQMWLEFRQELTPVQLAGFREHELTFRVEAQNVVRLFGSRKQLPDTPAPG
jgi:hypothetical protein